MTAQEAVAILEKATEGSGECATAIRVVRAELECLRDECERISVSLERACDKLVAAGLIGGE